MNAVGLNFHGIHSCILRSMCYTAQEVVFLGKLLELIRKYKGIILYILFGALTTAVNYAVSFPLFYRVGCSAAMSNTVAWFASVLFAFLTNKPFVFESNDWSFKTVTRELADFFGCRLLTGVLETVVVSVLVEIMGPGGFIWKILVSVLVVLLNYIGSKFFAFRKK